AGVVAVGEVAGRAAGGADPRVLRIVVGAGVAVVVETVAELGLRRDQAQARAVDRRRVGAGLAGRPARGAGARDAARRQGGAAQRQRLALLDAVVADADAVLAHRQRVGAVGEAAERRLVVGDAVAVVVGAVAEVSRRRIGRIARLAPDLV